MNQQFKTILLTVLTLSVFVIALVELSGVSNTALFNKYNIGEGGHSHNQGVNTAIPADSLKKLPKTIISFTDTKYDFGKVKEGAKVTHAYHFKNDGPNPLVISNAVASCGCTVPSYPKEPIAPGGEGDILVEFNSEGRVGKAHKNVLVYSNGQAESTSIGFDVEVIAK